MSLVSGIGDGVLVFAILGISSEVRLASTPRGLQAARVARLFSQRPSLRRASITSCARLPASSLESSLLHSGRALLDLSLRLRWPRPPFRFYHWAVAASFRTA